MINLELNKYLTNIDPDVPIIDMVEYAVETLSMFDGMLEEATRYETLFNATYYTEYSNESLVTLITDFCKWFVNIISRIIKAIVNFLSGNNQSVSIAGKSTPVKVTDPEVWETAKQKISTNKQIDTKVKNTPLPYDPSKWESLMVGVAPESGMTVLRDPSVDFNGKLSAITVMLKKLHDEIKKSLAKTTPKQYSLDELLFYGKNVLSSYFLLIRTSIENCNVILDKYQKKITPTNITPQLLVELANEIQSCISERMPKITIDKSKTFAGVGTKYDMQQVKTSQAPNDLARMAKHLIILIKRLLMNRTTESTMIRGILKEIYTRYTAHADMVHEEFPIPQTLVKRMGEYYGVANYKLEKLIITSILNWKTKIEAGDFVIGGLTVPGGSDTPTSVYLSTQVLTNTLFRHSLTNAYNKIDNTEEIPLDKCTQELALLHILLHEGCHVGDYQTGKNARYSTDGKTKYEEYDFEKKARLAERKFELKKEDITWARQVIAKIKQRL